MLSRTPSAIATISRSPYSGAAGQGRQAQPRARHRNRKADPQRGPQTSRRRTRTTKWKQRALHSLNDKELISAHVARVDVKRDHLAIQLSAKSDRDRAAQDRRHSAEQDETVHRDPHVLVVPWKKTPSKRPREIILPASTSSHPDPRPIRAETRAKLVTAIAKGRHWLDELIAGTVTNVEQIATREKCSIRQVNRTITLAFIAPTLVQAAVDGRLPRGIGVASVRDFPAQWSSQYERLGLAP